RARLARQRSRAGSRGGAGRAPLTRTCRARGRSRLARAGRRWRGQARGDEPRRSGTVPHPAHSLSPRGERQPGSQGLGIKSQRHVPPAAKTWTGMRELSYERRVQLLALAAGFPGSLIAMILLWHGSYSSGAVWTLAFLIFFLWLGFAFSLRSRVVFSLPPDSVFIAVFCEYEFELRV